jgi:hypothetical protein
MLPEVLEDDDFLQMSSAWRLVNILGLDIYTGERYGYSCVNGRVYSSVNTTIVAEIGTELFYQEPSKQLVSKLCSLKHIGLRR